MTHSMGKLENGEILRWENEKRGNCKIITGERRNEWDIWWWGITTTLAERRMGEKMGNERPRKQFIHKVTEEVEAGVTRSWRN